MRGRNRIKVSSVVMLALCGCSPDEPNVVVEVQPEQPAPAPESGGPTNMRELLDNVRAVDALNTVVAPCDQIAVLERQLVDLRTRYTENHPELVRVTQEITELRDSMPTDEACGSQGMLNQIRQVR